MNERGRLPTSETTSSSRTITADSRSSVLGAHRQGIRAVGFRGYVSNRVGRVWKFSQLLEEPKSLTDTPAHSNERGLALKVVLALSATSYVVLGVAAPDTAALLWAPYAILVFVLSLANLMRH